jgi:hypothetical protein
MKVVILDKLKIIIIYNNSNKLKKLKIHLIYKLINNNNNYLLKLEIILIKLNIKIMEKVLLI